MRWSAVYSYFFLIALLITLIIVPFCIRLAKKWRILDHPNKRKLHNTSIPLLGGVGIFISFSIVVWLHLLAAFILRDCELIQYRMPPEFFKYLEGIYGVLGKISVVFLGGVLVFFVGLFDDMKKLSIRTRVLTEIVIASFVVFMGIQPEMQFLPRPLTLGLTIVWVVGITNSFNLIDGADGLCAGVGLISTLLLGLVMAFGNQPMVAIFLVVFSGCLLGFLKYNFYPAKIFLGSAGSMFIGYILSVTVLVATFMTGETSTLFPLLVPILVLGIPLYDTLSVIAIRILHRKPIALADQNHLVHRLIRFGFTHKQAVLFVYLMAFCIGINSILLVWATYFMGIIILVQILATFAVIIILERVAGRFTEEDPSSRQ